MADQNEQLFFEAEPEEEASSFDLKKYLKGIKKRKWLVSIISLVIFIPWTIFIKQQPPIYEAETILHFKDFEGLNESLIQNRWTELTSRRFAEKVVQQLGLSLQLKDTPENKHRLKRYHVFQEVKTTNNPKFGDYALRIKPTGKFKLLYFPADIEKGVTIDSGYTADFIDKFYTINGFSFRFIENVDSLPAAVHFTISRFKYAVDDLLADQQMELRAGGALLSIKMTGPDPFMVTQTVNHLAEIYRKESIYIKESDAGNKLKVLTQRLELAEESLTRSAEALKEFERSHLMGLETEVGSQNQERGALLNEIENLELQKSTLNDMLAQIDTEINTNGSQNYVLLINYYSSLLQMPTFLNNSEMLILKTRFSELRMNREAKLTALTETHSSVKEIDSNIRLLNEEILRAAKRHLQSLALKISQAQRKIASIDRRLNLLPQERQQQNQLLREWQLDQDAYNKIKEEVQNAEMNITVETENIEIFQKAEMPEFPMNANKKKMAIIGFLVAVVFGVLVAAFIEFLDKTIQTPEEIKKHLKLNLIGSIPEIQFKETDDFKDEEKVKQIDNQLVTHDYSPTPIGEAYRSLRTNLLFSKQNGRINSFVITSTAPGDGKSFTSSNIAISMAQQRSKTLLVDADLRRGVIHNTFGIPKEPGFTNFLTNTHSFTQILNETYIPNLSVISCGSLLPNPSELLGSLHMQRFLEQARRRFEIVIFDSPPLNAATDAVVIGTQVDGVVLVVRVGKTHREVAKTKLEMFRNVPVRLLGAVLNGAESNLAHEGYSYYHY